MERLLAPHPAERRHPTVPGALTVTGTNARNAAVTRSGSSVSAANAGRYGALAPSASTGFGFQGTGSSGSAPALTCAAS